MSRLSLLDLFSGIGGFSLGLEATGYFQTHAFVEKDEFCRRVLQKHWPKVPQYDDIRDVELAEGTFDALCGGFPCQDVSLAAQGNQQSILGQRSGLWFEYYRLISEGMPKWVIIENVENLRHKGLSIILRQLADLGYDAEWNVIPAYAVGYPHVRNRLWIVAHLGGDRVERMCPFPLQRLRQVPWGAHGRSAAEWANRPNLAEAGLLRRGHGIPNYVDRINALGNSIIPAIAYEVGMAIGEWEYGPTAE